MRVALVGPVYPYRGGIAHHTSQLAQALSASHDARVFSYRAQYPRWLYPGRTHQDPSRQPLRTEAEFLLSPWSPLTWWRTADRIGAFAPDITLIQWWTTFWAPPYAGLCSRLRTRGGVVAFLVHNVVPHEPHPWDVALARQALRHAQVFIAHSPGVERRLKALFPGTPAVTCPLPLFRLAGGALPAKEVARERLRVPAGAAVVLFFGLVRPYKGLNELLEAVALLRREGAPIFLLVAGEVWGNRAAYRQRIARLGLADCVRFDDRYIPDEEVPLYFAAADVVAAPYSGGTQSAVVSLALGMGMRREKALPVVTTPVVAEGLPEGVRNVRVVQPCDPAALAEGIRMALCPGPDERMDASPSSPGETSHAGGRMSDGWEELVNRVEQCAALAHGAVGG